MLHFRNQVEMLKEIYVEINIPRLVFYNIVKLFHLDTFWFYFLLFVPLYCVRYEVKDNQERFVRVNM